MMHDPQDPAPGSPEEDARAQWLARNERRMMRGCAVAATILFALCGLLAAIRFAPGVAE